MNYAEMSDFEINLEVAGLLHPRMDIIESKSRPPCAVVTSYFPGLFLDYCNNPADAWPIIFGNLISVEPDYEFIDPSEDEVFATGLWIAEHFDGKAETVRHADPSPLRAAMIVFLMMKDGEK